MPIPASIAPLLLLAGLAGGAHAAPLNDAGAVPHLDGRGQEGYRQFLAAPLPRAFAVAPGGAWGWSGAAPSAKMAELEALNNCQANTQQPCQIYARDHAVVLDSASWVRSLGPYKTTAEAARAATGTRCGERFPDLVFSDAKGKRLKLSDLRGKVVVLHFWGSWCPPCKREMPDLAKLVASAKQAKDIRFVFLQVREDYAHGRAWANRIAKGLPLYDSGMTDSGDGNFRLADGTQIADRTIAMAFPTTYVIDKHGVAVFSHVGPVTGWEQYIPFLHDIATRSGK